MTIRELSAADVARLAQLHAETGAYEKIIEAAYTALLRTGDHAIDGGAHGGMHTLPMAKCVGPPGKVYAFEPLPHICAWLRGNVAGLDQVEVIEAALSDRSGSTIFHNVKAQPWMSSVHKRDFIQGETEAITVECVTLDSYQDRPVRFIKLDLESGEYHALKGGRRMLQKQRPIIICEWGGADAGRVAGYTADDYFGQLASIGYTTCDLFGLPFSRDDFGRPHGSRPDDIALFPAERTEVADLLARMTREFLDGARPQPH